MREYTKELKAEYGNLVEKLRFHNNSKDARRTVQERLQSINDEERSLLAHWAELSAKADTAAQRAYCTEAINLIGRRMDDRRKAARA